MTSESGPAQSAFIFRWCAKYGLSESTASVMSAEGFNSVAAMASMGPDDVKALSVPMGQRRLLRGALLQFKEADVMFAERRARKNKLTVEEALFMGKWGKIAKPGQPNQSSPATVGKQFSINHLVFN